MKDYFELGDGGAPQTAPILVEVAEDFDCTTEGVFQDPDNCSRCNEQLYSMQNTECIWCKCYYQNHKDINVSLKEGGTASKGIFFLRHPVYS